MRPRWADQSLVVRTWKITACLYWSKYQVFPACYDQSSSNSRIHICSSSLVRDEEQLGAAGAIVGCDGSRDVFRPEIEDCQRCQQEWYNSRLPFHNFLYKARPTNFARVRASLPRAHNPILISQLQLDQTSHRCRREGS
ncbi:hypothetical protein BDP27DRAFT_1325239, partial [Rhodocollybia butyracea]